MIAQLVLQSRLRRQDLYLLGPRLCGELPPLTKTKLSVCSARSDVTDICVVDEQIHQKWGMFSLNL